MSDLFYSSLPSYLHTPPVFDAGIPVRTLKSDLPFDKITWSDFEKLCLRLAREESDITGARIYGNPGNKQGGIDIFARAVKGGFEEKPYVVFQCKRVKKFTVAKINAAVKLFLKEDWASRSHKFVLCTSESIQSDTQRDEIERQREILSKEDIKLETWDSVELNLRLKNCHEIVDDFFGREWVKCFCGAQAAEQLGKRKRMDASQVRHYREKLAAFYQVTFDGHDRGLPDVQELQPINVAVQERFVVPDVLLKTNLAHFVASQEADESAAQIEPSTPAISTIFPFGSGLSTNSSASSPRFSFEDARKNAGKLRRALPIWAAEINRGLILGEPGSGKSVLLRYFVLDLLSQEPCMDQMAMRWGGFLPLWVPFGLWTKRLSEPEGDRCSLPDFLQQWFHSQDADALWPLVQQALEDERLLLFVDGLDEGVSLGASQQAVERLLNFLNQRNRPAILTSRPHGFDRLKPTFPTANWEVAELALWTREQQRDLAVKWFQKYSFSTNEVEKEGILQTRYQRMADELMHELGESGDLMDLAQVPLLLMLLIAFKMKSLHLPSNRYEVFRKTVEFMTETHPQQRKVSASLAANASTRSTLGAHDVRAIFADLAFWMQEKGHYVAVNELEAQRTVISFLRDEKGAGLGLPYAKAKELSHDLVDIGEISTGLFVKKSPLEVGFFHRSLGEYLAAHHIVSLDPSRVETLVRQHSGDSQWREVLLCLFYLLPSAQLEKCIQKVFSNLTPDATRSEDIVQDSILTANEEKNIVELLADVVSGPFTLPIGLARRIRREIVRRLEEGAYLPHQQRLLNSLMSGLRSTRFNNDTADLLRRWFPARHKYRSDIYSVTTRWPRTAEVEEQILAFLWRGLHDEALDNARAASRAIAKIFGQPSSSEKVYTGSDNVINAMTGETPKKNLGDCLALKVAQGETGAVQCAALDCLWQGWSEHPQMDALVDFACQSLWFGLRALGLSIRVSQGRHDAADRVALWELAGDRMATSAFENEIAGALIQGWKGDADLREQAMVACRDLDFNSAKKHIAARVVTGAFPQDDEVAQFFFEKKRMGTENEHAIWPSIHPQATGFVYKNFVDHPIAVAWADSVLDGDYIGMEYQLAPLCLIGRTPKAKQTLLERLPLPMEGEEGQTAQGRIWSSRLVEALLDGWPDDEEIREHLQKAAFGPVKTACRFAYLLPRIITNPDVCRARLLDLLRDPRSTHLDFVLMGLFHWREREGKEEWLDTEALDIALEFALPRSYVTTSIWSDDLSRVLPHLIVNYSADARVRELARAELGKENGYHISAAYAFGEYEEFRTTILAKSSPLSLALTRQIATRLRNGCGDEVFEEELLRSYADEPDDTARMDAAIGYFTRVTPSLRAKPQALQEICRKLSKDLEFRGIIETDLAPASYAGLLLLGQLELARPLLNDSRNRLRLEIDSFRPNWPLAHFLLDHWEIHKEFTGDSLWKVHAHLSAHKDDYAQTEFWELVLPIIDAYPKPQAELMKFLEDHGTHCRDNISFETEILVYLANKQPKSQRVRDLCLDQMHMNSCAAGRILGEQWAGDPNVLHDLMHETVPVTFDPSGQQERHHFDPNHIVALCEGFNEPEMFASWLQQFKNRSWETPSWEEAETEGKQRLSGLEDLLAPYFQLVCRAGSTEDVVQAVRLFLEQYPMKYHYSNETESVLRPLRRRIQESDETAEALWHILDASPNNDSSVNTATPSEKASLPGLLQENTQIRDKVSDWISKELEKQRKYDQPLEAGYDWFVGDIRPVLHSLLDVARQL